MEKDTADLLIAAEQRQTTMELAFIGMAAAIAEHDKPLLGSIIKSLEFMRVWASVQRSKEVADGFLPLLEWLHALNASVPNPLSSFALDLHAAAATPKHLRAARETWLAMATPEEIASELNDQLKTLLAKSKPTPKEKRKRNHKG